MRASTSGAITSPADKHNPTITSPADKPLPTSGALRPNPLSCEMSSHTVCHYCKTGSILNKTFQHGKPKNGEFCRSLLCATTKRLGNILRVCCTQKTRAKLSYLPFFGFAGLKSLCLKWNLPCKINGLTLSTADRAYAAKMYLGSGYWKSMGSQGASYICCAQGPGQVRWWGPGGEGGPSAGALASADVLM